jgi:hypothetical protein
MELIKLILSDFWYFIAFLIIFGMIITFIYKIFNRILRHYSLMKHGYPPEHCDADGELPEMSEEITN